MLHRKIFDLMVHLGDIDTHALGGAHVRRSNRSGEESQLQTDPGQEKCSDRDNGMCAHDGSVGCKCPRLAMRDVMQSTAAAASSEPMRLLLLLPPPSGRVARARRPCQPPSRPAVRWPWRRYCRRWRNSLAGEKDPALVAVSPVPSPAGRSGDLETGRLRN